MVIASISLLIRRMYASWNPLEDPGLGITVFTKWRRLLKTYTKRTAKKNAVDDAAFQDNSGYRVMTPFEALMYNVWLPPVRSAVNNSWTPRNPEPFIHLLETWYTTSSTPETTKSNGILEHVNPKSPQILPPWLYANIINQLVMPKLRAEMDDWNPKRDYSLIHTWLFPWLPVLGDIFNEFFEPVQQKFAIMFSEWFPEDKEPVKVLTPWLEIFPATITNSLLNKIILPKLVATLRFDFTVNPASQNNQPLELIFPWRQFFTTSTFSHLLETEFFPKWIKTLHAWLSSPNVSYDEVSQWYVAWKNYFPPDVLAMPGVTMQFGVGVELMHKSLSLREGETLVDVPKIVPYASIETMKKLVDGGTARPVSSLPEFQRKKETTMSFRDLLEKAAGERGLTLLPSTKVHALGKPLLRLGGSTDGRDVGGVLLYIDDAVLFLQEGRSLEEAWSPVSLDEAVQAALLRRHKP
ncbi:hypothetical protein HDU67_000761 [Dinochytrium kinnereticum]|nr:hypothetical protein HDU67_000761 [Dinochytrium kinnereticum]